MAKKTARKTSTQPTRQAKTKTATEPKAGGGKRPKKKAAAGRPLGSKTERYDTQLATPSHCKKCNSTNRLPYFGTPIRTKARGLKKDGSPYNVIVRRRTRCKDCNQLRLDFSQEFDPALEDE